MDRLQHINGAWYALAVLLAGACMAGWSLYRERGRG
jgi:hypothetical protein